MINQVNTRLTASTSTSGASATASGGSWVSAIDVERVERMVAVPFAAGPPDAPGR